MSANSYSSGSLYVGDLSPDVTEAVLFERFSRCGPVLSIRVCRDLITRRSLGYAYVNFQDSSDSEKAIEALNFDYINGRQMRVMKCQRNPLLRKSGKGNVFIKNLDKSIDNSILFDTFSSFGKILSCKLATDSNGLSKGFGFVHFESEESAFNAIEKLNSMALNGKKVFVGKFIPRQDRNKNINSQTTTFTNIYVKNFGQEFDDQSFVELFEHFGQVLSAKIMTDTNGKSKGFGFVSFNNSESAERAVKELNGKELSNGNSLYVSRAQKKAERQQQLKSKYEELKQKRMERFKGVNLYVKHLDDSIDEHKLRQEFSPFGTITSVKLMTDGFNCPKGFGFVCFSKPEEAQTAVNHMNNRIIGNKPLYVAIAQTKEERKQYLMSNRMQRVGGQDLRMQSMAVQPMAHQHHPQSIPHTIPAAAAMAFVANPAMALNAFGSQMPISWNDPRRNRRHKFFN